MPAFEVPKEDVVEIMEALDIQPEGYALQLQNEDTIALIHFKTHLEVIIRKGVKKEWLSMKKPCLPG